MRHLHFCTTAMLGAFLAFGSTGASAGAGQQASGAVIRPPHGSMGGSHGVAGPTAYRPLPPPAGLRTTANVVYGTGGVRPRRTSGQGPAIYAVQGPAPLVAHESYGHGRRFAGRERAERFDPPERGGRRFDPYGYGLAATVGGAAGYGYGAGYGYDDGGYNSYGAADVPLTVAYGEAPLQPVSGAVAYDDGPRLSGGDDVQTNGYASPYNPYRLVGYATVAGGFGGYGYRGYDAGTGFMYAIPPAGGLAVYSPGAYGPGPRIIHIPSHYRRHGHAGCTCGSFAHE
jgi:hypothetical protein